MSKEFFFGVVIHIFIFIIIQFWNVETGADGPMRKQPDPQHCWNKRNTEYMESRWYWLGGSNSSFFYLCYSMYLSIILASAIHIHRLASLASQYCLHPIIIHSHWSNYIVLNSSSPWTSQSSCTPSRTPSQRRTRSTAMKVKARARGKPSSVMAVCGLFGKPGCENSSK